MKLKRIVACGGLGLVLAWGIAARGEEPAKEKVNTDQKELLIDKNAKPKTDKPAEKKNEKQKPAAKISPEAQAELNQISAAYKKLNSLKVEGKIELDYVVAGQADHKSAAFTGTFSAPNKFRHETAGDIIIGSTGEKLYAYRPLKNEYVTVDAPKARVDSGEIPNPMRDILQMQNAGLMCAIVDDAGKFLAEGVKEVSRGSDISLENKSYTDLEFKGAMEDYKVLVDPQTHWVRQVIVDQKRSIKAKGQPDVEKALVTLNYTSIVPDAKPAEAQFAWAAPEGAKDAAASAAEVNDAMALIGKDAPDFALNDLDGKAVAFKDMKGSVVVLDFWATWCGPCRASLPGLNKIYKELQSKGMKAYAVDLQEGKEIIQPVKAQLIPDIPVLLDEKSDVAHKYGVSGIPQTVVIGKDGKVKKVFIGSGNEANIRRAVDSALAE